MQRRLVAIAVFVVGVVLLVVPLVSAAFPMATAGEEALDDARRILDSGLLDRVAADLDDLRDVAAEYEEGVVPALALARLSTPARTRAFLAETYPAVDAGIAALAETADRFGPLLERVRRITVDIDVADGIPASGLPAWTAPPAMLTAGVAAVGLGIWMLRRPARGVAGAAAVLGVVVIGIIVILGLPAKVGAAERVINELDPVMRSSIADAGAAALDAAVEAAEQADRVMIPDLAARLPLVDEAGLRRLLAAGFPAIDRALASWPDQAERVGRLIEVQSANLDRYATVADGSPRMLLWTALGAGIALVGLGLAGLRRSAG